MRDASELSKRCVCVLTVRRRDIMRRTRSRAAEEAKADSMVTMATGKTLELHVKPEDTIGRDPRAGGGAGDYDRGSEGEDSDHGGD
jgi:hypothetical protein